MPLQIPEQEPLTPQVLLSIILIKKQSKLKQKKNETLMSINSRKIKIYSEKIQDISCEFVLETELNHLEKEKLLELPNPKYICSFKGSTN